MFYFLKGKINMNDKTLYKIASKNAFLELFISIDIYPASNYMCQVLCWAMDIQQ